MEHELANHTKKVLKTWRNPSKSFWEKVKEIVIEILIIVFAVTLSIWVHDRSEYNHEQKEVRQFLHGLKSDLRNNIHEMEGDRASFLGNTAAFTYFTSVRKTGKLSTDSLRKYVNYLNSSTTLIPYMARYESFKSSGKLINIEDNDLQNNIAELFEEKIPLILASSTAYANNKQQLFTYIRDNFRQNDDGTTNMSEILLTDRARNIITPLIYTSEIVTRYTDAINESNKIIAAIDKEYSDE